MTKWCLNDLNILEYEKNEVTLKNLSENSEDEIRDLNRIMYCLKTEDKEIWKRKWIIAMKKKKEN